MSTNYSLNDVHEQSFSERIASKLKKDVIDFAKEKKNFFIKNDICPACKHHSTNYRFTCFELDYYQCNKCNTIFLNPCPEDLEIVGFLNSSEALRIWREEMPSKMQKTREKMYNKRSQLIKKNVDSLGFIDPILVEVGGGRGELSLKLSELNLFKEIHVVEPQELSLNKENIKVHRCTFENLKLDLNVDCIVSFEVIEHLIDPISFFNKAYELLNPGGILILTTPNGNSFEVELLQERSTQIPFDHIRLYNPEALKIMLEKNGKWSTHITTPGVFDVELLDKAMPIKNKILSDCLKFILCEQTRKNDFQKFLVNKNRSSHMCCIARKSN